MTSTLLSLWNDISTACLFDGITDSLISPSCGPVVLPNVMTFRPGEMGARFQLSCATGCGRPGPAGCDASFCRPGA